MENIKVIPQSTQNIFDELFKDMIGNDIQFTSPIETDNNKENKKFLIYADFTASGKGLKRIEKFIKYQILPTYANVHSTVGHCAELTTKYLEEAKKILRIYTNANGNYSIIYHGQGATGGVHKLIETLSIKKYESFYNDLETAFQIKERYGDEDFEKFGESLIKKIKNQFEELFININFCFKFKEKNNYITKCILCKKNMENEGDYHKHIQGETHQSYLKDFKENSSIDLFSMNEHSITDFIDEIRKNYNINSKQSLLNLINDYKRFKPVVFYSLYEHNSNSLSWRETQCEIVIIEGEYENFYQELKDKLQKYKDNYIKIGSFTAASNITGLLLDVDRIAFLIHQAKGFAFFDYAAAAPYLKIDVSRALPDDYREMLKFIKLNDYQKNLSFKDGMFFSPHKFIGGPNTPGVLITHDRIYRNQLKPTQPGGGTVNFVYNNNIDYIQDVELKEESGTPNIIGGIRLGLMISIMSNIQQRDILKKEEHYISLFLHELENIKNLYILHDKLLRKIPHIPIFSFMISFGNKFLHPNYICALLNDLFGIQSRPGCSCAPNYGKFLLGFDSDENFDLLKKLTTEGKDIFKPGYVRLNLPFFYPEYVIKYIISAIKIICENGHLLLGLYNYNIKTGKFYYYNSPKISYSLHSFNFFKDLPINEELYDYKNSRSINEEELNEILLETNAFLSGYSFLKRTFITENNQPQQRLKFENFGDGEIARWFCVFNDVKPLLERLYIIQFENKITPNPEEDEETKKLIEDFEEKGKQKKSDWSTKYQSSLNISMIDV